MMDEQRDLRERIAMAIFRAASDDNLRQLKEFGNAMPFADAVLAFAHPPAAEPVGLREAVQRFMADVDDGDRAEAGLNPLMEAHVADFRQALAIPARTDDDGDIMLLADEAVSWALDNFGGYSCSPVDAGISYMQARGKDRWSMQAQMDASLSPAPDRGEGEA